MLAFPLLFNSAGVLQRELLFHCWLPVRPQRQNPAVVACGSSPWGAHKAQATKLQRNASWKMAERNQGNYRSLRYSKNRQNLFTLNIYINAGIFDLCTKCCVSQSNNNLSAVTTSVFRFSPNSPSSHCSFPQIRVPAGQGCVQLHVSCPPF